MGQPGNGKSMVASIIAIAALRGEYWGLKWNDTSRNPNVLYFDTEQMVYESAYHAKRIISAAGRNTGKLYDDFHYLRANEGVNVEECRQLLMAGVREIEPNVIIIDGAPDCVRSINDEIECKDFIDFIREMAAAYCAVVICVAHQNHGTDKMLGFLGSILERKETNGLEVIKHKDSKEGFLDKPPFYEVRTVKVRGEDIEGFTFRLEYDGEFVIPFITSVKNSKVKEEVVRNNDFRAIAAEVFKEKTVYGSKNKLTTAIRVTYCKSKDWAEARLQEMVDNRLVLVHPKDAQNKQCVYEYYKELPF